MQRSGQRLVRLSFPVCTHFLIKHMDRQPTAGSLNKRSIDRDVLVGIVVVRLCS